MSRITILILILGVAEFGGCRKDDPKDSVQADSEAASATTPLESVTAPDGSYAATTSTSNGNVRISDGSNDGKVIKILDETGQPIQDIRVISTRGKSGTVLFAHNENGDIVPELRYIPASEVGSLDKITLSRHVDWQTFGTNSDLRMYQRWTHVHEGLKQVEIDDFVETLSEIDTRDSNWKRRVREFDKATKPIRYAITAVKIAATAGASELVTEVFKAAAGAVLEDVFKQNVLASQFDEWTEFVHEQEETAIILPHEPKAGFGSVAILVTKEAGGNWRGSANGIPGVTVTVSGSSGATQTTTNNGSVFFLQVEPGKQTVVAMTDNVRVAIVSTREIAATGEDYNAGHATLINLGNNPSREIMVEPGRITSVELTITPRSANESVNAAELLWRRSGTKMWSRRELSPNAIRWDDLIIPGKTLDDGTVEWMVSISAQGRRIASNAFVFEISQCGLPSTSLHDAVAQGLVGEIQKHLCRGVNAGGFDDAGATPLHIAAETGNDEIIDLLLSHGANPSVCAERESCYTPLHAAAAKGHTSVVAKLVRHGAIVDCCDGRGHTAYQIALLQRHSDVQAFLAESGANTSPNAASQLLGARVADHDNLRGAWTGLMIESAGREHPRTRGTPPVKFAPVVSDLIRTQAIRPRGLWNTAFRRNWYKEEAMPALTKNGSDHVYIVGDYLWAYHGIPTGFATDTLVAIGRRYFRHRQVLFYDSHSSTVSEEEFERLLVHTNLERKKHDLPTIDAKLIGILEFAEHADAEVIDVCAHQCQN